MDAIAAVTHADPYPYYAALAARPGLFFDAGLKLWIAAGAADVAAVLGHADLRVRPAAEPVPAAIAGGSAGQVFGALVRMNDGERHAAPKLVLQRALASLDLAAVHARASEVANAGIAAARPGVGGAGGSGKEDDSRVPARCWPMPGALSAWMLGVPVRTVASLLGFPDAQLPQVAAWMGEFVACLSPLSSAEQVARSHGAALALLDSFKAMLQASGALPGSLLAKVLAEADAAGWNNANAILANLVGLLSQTYEATAGLIGNSVVAVLREPARAGLPAAVLVANVMRDDPPIQNTRRFAAHAVDIGGARVEAGQAILVLLAAANKGYGQGVHACPGQALSQTIAAAAVGVLLRDGPIAPMAWRYRPSVNARIPEFIDAQGNA
ncbi:cytochrome [Massilia sp. Root418]|uniref:cytochrome P450 n=1 Tax=Massilia sp. Root418 TaxID=1736532 RepID=UPI0006F96434|nr:cytochrome P450 [Massilia sp. Root418]KQW91508.1 cytochrome [Massilia sp. Root418]